MIFRARQPPLAGVAQGQNDGPGGQEPGTAPEAARSAGAGPYTVRAPPQEMAPQRPRGGAQRRRGNVWPSNKENLRFSGFLRGVF